ncbi:MAG: zinc-binding dehydrogenase [Spirochaetota bacterium]
MPTNTFARVSAVPSEMMAAQLDAVGEPLVVREIPVPCPEKGEVLVKTAASPINPSDIAFMMGGYGFARGLPVTPGNEGSGVVVAAGAGLMAKRLVGRRVACFARKGLAGAWAEYMVTNASLCVPLSSDTTFEQAATSLINPLTAQAFMQIVRSERHPAFVNTAAASSLGRMLVRMSSREGIPLINVVRDETQVSLLRSMGAEHVLDSTGPDFEEHLTALTQELRATLFLDAVGGPLLGRLLTASPRGTTILAYGRLSDEPCVIEPGALILQRKRIVGFFLSEWMERRNILQILADIRRVQRNLSREMQTYVRQRVPLEDVRDALDAYRRSMTEGKVLLVPAGSA